MNTESFDEFYDQYADSIYGICISNTPSEAHADAKFIAVFTHLMNTIDQFNGTTISMKSWVIASTVIYCNDDILSKGIKKMRS